MNSPGSQLLVSLLIHPTQFPAAVEASLCESLRTREMNHKFHYDTPKQTLRWLRLHEAFSPARTDVDCERIYTAAFDAAASRLDQPGEIEVVSLGSGGGQKDVQLLRQLGLKHPGVRLSYTPVDVSAGLALHSRSAAIEVGLSPDDVIPVVADLAEAPDWVEALRPALGKASHRIVCFFGMLPNFTPEAVIPQLAHLLRPTDFLLVSANLSPGPDYGAGVERVMPLYDNPLTREWLWSVLLDLGIESRDGVMEFGLSSGAGEGELIRIEASVRFNRPCGVDYAGRRFNFAAGEVFRLFFSYRYTPALLASRLKAYGVGVLEAWTNGTGEEGVFLCQREVLMDPQH